MNTDPLPLETLLDQWAAADLAVYHARIEQHRLEVQIKTLMHESRAELVESRLAEATYRPAVEYDRSILATLAEVIPPEEFARMLSVPKDPVVDARKAREWAKKGDPWRSIVENARREGPPTLKVMRKE